MAGDLEEKGREKVATFYMDATLQQLYNVYRNI